MRKECEEQTAQAWKMLQPNPSRMVTPRDLLEGSWEFDTFPYTIWQFWRLKLYRPKEASLFFWQYKDCMRRNKPGGKSFFNYCKTVLYHARREAGDLLVAEVESLEVWTRSTLCIAMSGRALNVPRRVPIGRPEQAPMNQAISSLSRMR